MVLPTDIVEDVLLAHDDLYVVPGPAPRPRRPTAQSSAATTASSSPSPGTNGTWFVQLDSFLHHGPSICVPRKTCLTHRTLPSTHPGTGDDQGLRCRNYGCNKTFAEAENSDSACRFHTAPPVFHDTKKGWSCCPKRVYDWDEFNLVRASPACIRVTHPLHRQPQPTTSPLVFADRGLRCGPAQRSGPQAALCPISNRVGGGPGTLLSRQTDS